MPTGTMRPWESTIRTRLPEIGRPIGITWDARSASLTVWQQVKVVFSVGP